MKKGVKTIKQDQEDHKAPRSYSHPVLSSPSPSPSHCSLGCSQDHFFVHDCSFYLVKCDPVCSLPLLPGPPSLGPPGLPSAAPVPSLVGFGSGLRSGKPNCEAEGTSGPGYNILNTASVLYKLNEK
jgi:hypothetical protein